MDLPEVIGRTLAQLIRRVGVFFGSVLAEGRDAVRTGRAAADIACCQRVGPRKDAEDDARERIAVLVGFFDGDIAEASVDHRAAAVGVGQRAFGHDHAVDGGILLIACGRGDLTDIVRALYEGIPVRLHAVGGDAVRVRFHRADGRSAADPGVRFRREHAEDSAGKSRACGVGLDDAESAVGVFVICYDIDGVSVRDRHRIHPRAESMRRVV